MLSGMKRQAPCKRWDALVDVVEHERKIEQEGEPLAREKEEQGEEGMGDVLWQDKLRIVVSVSAGHATRD